MSDGYVAGVLVWVIAFVALTPLFYPWFARAEPWIQLLLHVFAFGIPMGLVFAALDRRRAGTTRSLAP
jgi:hypothetical protein